MKNLGVWPADDCSGIFLGEWLEALRIIHPHQAQGLAQMGLF